MPKFCNALIFGTLGSRNLLLIQKVGKWRFFQRRTKIWAWILKFSSKFEYYLRKILTSNASKTFLRVKMTCTRYLCGALMSKLYNALICKITRPWNLFWMQQKWQTSTFWAKINQYWVWNLEISCTLFCGIFQTFSLQMRQKTF